jgi:glycosyltransferase involved in cell wall biosynthesis
LLNALPALRVAGQLGLPVVYEVRAFWEDAAVDHGTTTEGSMRYRLTRRLETHALRKADHVFAICEGLRRDIVGRGVADSKVTVIPNAVDVDAFEVGGRPDPCCASSSGSPTDRSSASSVRSTRTRDSTFSSMRCPEC